jgi:hypothetical protein
LSIEIGAVMLLAAQKEKKRAKASTNKYGGKRRERNISTSAFRACSLRKYGTAM